MDELSSSKFVRETRSKPGVYWGDDDGYRRPPRPKWRWYDWLGLIIGVLTALGAGLGKL